MLLFALFLSAQEIRYSLHIVNEQNNQTAYSSFEFAPNKDNEQLPFSDTFASASLQYDIPFSKNISLASVLQ